jgi:hypothetical protein
MKEQEDRLLLKWGTIKGWHFNSEKAKELFKEYCDIGSTWSAMMQKNTPRQKEIILELIDVCDVIENDWDGITYENKQDAKDYILNYGKK